jgi:hypothetical protein
MDLVEKAVIISFYMQNCPTEFRDYQQKVVQKFNPGYQHAQVQYVGEHGAAMNQVLNMAKDQGVKVVLFLDIDAIPLHKDALHYYIKKAADGFLVGNAQRSNHIINNQHVYCGSPCVGISVENWIKIGSPSAKPTTRGDVAEELTYAAEAANLPIDIVMPSHHDAPPIRMHWENDIRPYWPLADGMPVYGIGTTYELPGIGNGLWHMFQSFHPGQKERFINKCKEVLT